MSRTTKGLVAGFDAVVMGFAAYSETGGRFGLGAGELVLWGAAVGAVLCAIVVLLDGWPLLAWAGIGYVLFGALLTTGSPHWTLLALAIALMPLVPRPRGSLVLGLAVAAVVAVASYSAIDALL